MYPERILEWGKTLKLFVVKYPLSCMLLEQSLQVMEGLESGTTPPENYIELFDSQGFSGNSASVLRKIVLSYSKKGPDFFRKTAFIELTDEEKAEILIIESENKAFAEFHTEWKAEGASLEFSTEVQDNVQQAPQGESTSESLASLEDSIVAVDDEGASLEFSTEVQDNVQKVSQVESTASSSDPLKKPNSTWRKEVDPGFFAIPWM
jgi:hypothetical protein